MKRLSKIYKFLKDNLLTVSHDKFARNLGQSDEGHVPSLRIRTSLTAHPGDSQKDGMTKLL